MPTGYHSNTLCWSCGNAVPNDIDGCEWSRDGEPVPGWDAEEKTRTDTDGRFYRTICVHSCPKYTTEHHAPELTDEGAMRLAVGLVNNTIKEYGRACRKEARDGTRWGVELENWFRSEEWPVAMLDLDGQWIIDKVRERFMLKERAGQMTTVNFTIPGKPGAKGRPRFTRYGKTYTPKETVEYENLVRLEYQQQSEGVKFPEDICLSLRVEAYYSMAQSTPKKKRQRMLSGEIRPGKKPDVDNVLKIVADALNDIAYHDDSQIVEATVVKNYSDDPRVEVTITNTGSMKG